MPHEHRGFHESSRWTTSHFRRCANLLIDSLEHRDCRNLRKSETNEKNTKISAHAKASQYDEGAHDNRRSSIP